MRDCVATSDSWHQLHGTHQLVCDYRHSLDWPSLAQWVDALKASTQNKAVLAPREPTWAIRKVFFYLVTSRPFDFIVISVIVFNVLAMVRHSTM